MIVRLIAIVFCGGETQEPVTDDRAVVLIGNPARILLHCTPFHFTIKLDQPSGAKPIQGSVKSLLDLGIMAHVSVYQLAPSEFFSSISVFRLSLLSPKPLNAYFGDSHVPLVADSSLFNPPWLPRGGDGTWAKRGSTCFLQISRREHT